MTIKAKILKIGDYWVDSTNNGWSTAWHSKPEASRLSLSMMDCRDCFDCHNMIDCHGCVKCYNCVDCDRLFDRHDVHDEL